MNLRHEKCAEQEVSSVMSWNTVEIKIASAKGHKSYLATVITDIMTGFR